MPRTWLLLLGTEADSLILDPDDRTRVVAEMLTTEQSYLHGIEIMLNNYLYPLRKAAQKDKENTKKDAHKKVENSDVDSIFLNIEQLHLINSNLYEQLLKRLEEWETNDTIGDLLAEWVCIKIYTSIISSGSNYHHF